MIIPQTIITVLGIFLPLALGCVIGYYVRQSLAKKRAGSLEAKLQKRVQDVKQEKLKEVKENLDNLRLEAETKLEKVASLSREDAKKELLSLVEVDYQKDILERIKKIEESGKETLDR